MFSNGRTRAVRWHMKREDVDVFADRRKVAVMTANRLAEAFDEAWQDSW